MRSLPPRCRLKHCLSYDVCTGLFTWVNPASRSVKPGQIAGRVSNNGYRRIMLDGVRYSAHHLAWLWVTGEVPTQPEIDHRNGKRDDNRFSNLRQATKAQNQQNVVARKHNKTGFLGVSLHASKKWVAQIRVNGVKKYLGLFDTPEDAHVAYLSAKKLLHEFQPEPRRET